MYYLHFSDPNEAYLPPDGPYHIEVTPTKKFVFWLFTMSMMFIPNKLEIFIRSFLSTKLTVRHILGNFIPVTSNLLLI